MKAEATQCATGRYSASLLGTIRANLEGLQGYDVMALELIQNADDAGAKEISFEVSEAGLSVWNSGQFSYCGSLEDATCPRLKSEGYACDFHRITEVASGGKLRKSDNIGRFGIGFVSTYQITDHPRIQSAGIVLTLFPERGEWQLTDSHDEQGTRFLLPWADDPHSPGRSALGLSAVDKTHLSGVVQDISDVLKGSLLFLRNVTRADLRNETGLVFSCELDRGGDSELLVTFRPDDYVEQWHILRADASERAAQLTTQHLTLRDLNRATNVSIGIRVEPEPLLDGCLYAYLPTNQSSGLPLHINADFFPEPDRKAVIFSGHQHQQAWNEMLLETAAKELARDLPSLSDKLGTSQLWDIISKAFDLSKSIQIDRPKCYEAYWQYIESAAKNSAIVKTATGDFRKPNQTLISNASIDPEQVQLLSRLAAYVVADDLKPHRNVLLQLDVQLLTLDRLASLMAGSDIFADTGTEIDAIEFDTVYLPIWNMLDNLLAANPGRGPRVLPADILNTPFLLDHNNVPVSPAECVLVRAPLASESVCKVMPFLRIALKRLSEFKQLSIVIPALTLERVVTCLSVEFRSGNTPEEILTQDRSQLKSFYSQLAALDSQTATPQEVYEQLCELRIWPTSKRFVKACESLLPGDFEDPTGESDLLDPACFTPSAREFIERKLGVHNQSLETFVRDFLPRFVGIDGPTDPTKYPRLVLELSRHVRLINDDSLRSLLASLALVPTADGKWATPGRTYFRTEELAAVLGDNKALWVDVTRAGADKSTKSFLRNLGIRQTPSPEHLVQRMWDVTSAGPPNNESIRACAAAFYELCRHHEASDVVSVLKFLSTLRCFPAEEDAEHWHLARELYAPYRSEGFNSQVKILAFRDTQRLSYAVLEQLGVTMEPDTRVVVRHLQWCVENSVEPHVFTYQILNERSPKEESVVSELGTERCIFVDVQKGFVYPRRVFWTSQPLGQYAFTVSPKIEAYRAFFRAVGVKDRPTTADYVDVLLELIGRHHKEQKPVDGDDRAVYDQCLKGIAESTTDGELSDLEPLRLAPCVINLQGQLCHPDEVMFRDSEWHAGLFDGALDGMLCRPAAELWHLFSQLGVTKLSDLCAVKLDLADGDEQSEQKLTNTLQERSSVIVRLLHDKSSALVNEVSRVIAGLVTSTYEYVQIQGVIIFDGAETVSAAKKVPAFYDRALNALAVARPVTSRTWPHVFTALFHQLLHDDTASDISKLALVLDSLVSLPVEEAHERLTEAGIPVITNTQASMREPLSTSLESVGSEVTDGTQPAVPKPPEKSSEAQPVHPVGTVLRTDAVKRQDGGLVPPTDSSPAEADIPTITALPVSKSPRPHHKQAWDARLVSYVKHKQPTPDVSENDGNEHNLAVEIEARKAVCDYELLRGRIPQQMPQQHPGFDIVSVDSRTDDQRRIEVKALSGEWNKRGVGVSRTQFSNAEEFGPAYWVYVVEFSMDPKNRRIYAIQNPAFKVTEFMFDGNWRDVALKEMPDPAYAFVPGVKVRHQLHGQGLITDIEIRGATRMLRIDFEKGGMRILPLNITAMEVLEDEDGSDHT
jgi:hypothetical protein